MAGLPCLPQSFGSHCGVSWHAVLLLFFFHLSINFCFLWMKIQQRAVLLLLDLWAFWMPASLPNLTPSRTSGSCLSPESVPSFSPCPALLLCLPNARSPPTAPGRGQEYVLNVLDGNSRSKYIQLFWYLDLNVLAAWLVLVWPLWHKPTCKSR